MIDYFFGRPRTGKTYRAVKFIYDEYIVKENLKSNYTNIITNIAGFKFKEVNQIFRDRGSKSYVYKLIWDDLYKHLKVMYGMALEEKSDEELNRYAYSHKINDCLIVFDEASLRFKRYDDVLSWFLAYHGHFKLRIIIIAQGPRQINPDYLEHTEIYYEAQKQSKQLRDNQLRYIHYDEIPFNKNNKFGSDTIKTSQKIYDLYKSGEVDKPKKVLYKYIFYMFLALLVMVGLYQILMYRLSPPVDENKIEVLEKLNSTYQNKQEQEQEQEENDFISLSNSQIVLNLRCDDKNCWNFDNLYESNTISLSYFKYLVITYKLKLQFSEVKNEIFKLSMTKRGFSKKSLAYFTDYHYVIPKQFKKTYLSNIFKSVKKEFKNNNNLNLGKNFASGDMTSALARIE